MSFIFNYILTRKFLEPILQSIIAAYIYDGTNSVFKRMFRKEQGNLSSFESRLEKIFYATVDRVVVNDAINKDIKRQNFEKYQKAIKQELLSGESKLNAENLDGAVYDAFKQELLHEPLFCIKLLLKYCACRKQQEEMVKEIKLVLDKVKNIEAQNNKILEVSQKIYQKNGLSSNISISSSSEFKIHIPDRCSQRQKVVDGLVDRLSVHKVILLYGGVQSGKTVLSGLLARSFKAYEIVYITFMNGNYFDIRAFLEGMDKNRRLIFILDAVKYDQGDLYDEFIHILKSYTTRDWLFIINSYDKISDYLQNFNNEIEEYEVPKLSEEEVEELIPEQYQSTWLEIIWSLSWGQPSLLQLLLHYLDSLKWSTTSEDLGKIFSFTSERKIQDKVRTVMYKMIGDNDTLQLFYRLLLFKKGFTEEECREIADVTPTIKTPITKLHHLLHTWISQDENNLYVASPYVKKVIAPDLGIQELRNCCAYLVPKILGKHTLDFSDIVYIMTLFVKAKDYDSAGKFYVGVIIKFIEQKIYDGFEADLLACFWKDTNLPMQMSEEVKASIRVIQLLYSLHRKEGLDLNVAIQELETILHKDFLEPDMQMWVSFVLTGFYGIQGNAKKSLENRALSLSLLHKEQNSDLSKFIQESKMDEFLPWVQLEHINTKQDLFTWFSQYHNLGYKDFDCYYEGCFAVIERLTEKVCDIERDVLYDDIISETEKYGSDLDAFKTACISKFLDKYRTAKNEHGLIDVYGHYQDLLFDDFGKLVINYEMGIAYFDWGNLDKAGEYLEAACEVDDMRILCNTYLHAHVLLAKIVGTKDAKKSLSLIQAIIEHERFHDCFLEIDRIKVICTYAFALWKVGDYKGAVKQLCVVEDYLWKKKDKNTNEFKELAIKINIFIRQIDEVRKNGKTNDDLLIPDYDFFIRNYEKLLPAYKSAMLLASNLLLIHVVDEYINDEKLELHLMDIALDFYKSQVDYKELVMLLFSMIPLLLKNDRVDDVEYLIKAIGECHFDSDGCHTDINKAIRQTSLFFLAIYVASCTMQKKYFNHAKFEWLLEDDKVNLDDKQSWLADKLCHLKYIEANQVFTVPLSTCLTLKKTNHFYFTASFCNSFLYDYANYMISLHKDWFDVKDKNLVLYFSKAKKNNGFEQSSALLRAFYFLMKSQPKLDEEGEKIVFA